MEIELICPQCKTELQKNSKFCYECGVKIGINHKNNDDSIEIMEERKFVTVLFSDLSGYTAMSEKLDPEEVKEIMSKLFSRCSEIVKKYNGYIDKFIGDCVMIIFGVPSIHENDAERAIRTAIEIHNIPFEINTQELTNKIGRPLSMHTGINTGLVVTGDLDINLGKEKILGDTVNVASRLTSLAGADEILVGETTFHSTERYFEFEEKELASVKGKSEKIKSYAYKTIKSQPDVIRRLTGKQASLIGRNTELEKLTKAIESLEIGKSSIISITGEAGAGKSRLVSEFTKTVADFHFRIITSYSLSHQKNFSYYLWIDLLTRLFKINEDDNKEKIIKKTLDFFNNLNGFDSENIPFIHYLFSIITDDIKQMEAGYLKAGIERAVINLVKILGSNEKCVFIFEDIHWADPSSLELLFIVLAEPDIQSLFLNIQRPVSDPIFPEILSESILVIELKPLSKRDEYQMLQSLLESDEIPEGIQEYVLSKAGGNPLYIEELINNLIEVGYLEKALVWKINKAVSIVNTPGTISEIILERVDRLNNETKKVIQIASVIGRTFYYSILSHIIKETYKVPGNYITELENLDFIKQNELGEEIEYMFKHALLQETIYNSVLNKEKRIIHEKIGKTIEVYFHTNLDEFYETLAFHYEKAGNTAKAVYYLVKAGEKSYKRYASIEANIFYQKAYDQITTHLINTEDGLEMLFDLLGKWGFVHYSLGAFEKMEKVFEIWKNKASNIKDKNSSVLYFSWVAWSQLSVAKFVEAGKTFSIALNIAEKNNAGKYLAYTYCWYSNYLLEAGNLQSCIKNAELAIQLASEITDDLYIWAKSIYPFAVACLLTGQRTRGITCVNEALTRLENIKHSRARTLIYQALARCYLINNEYEKSIYYAEQGFQAAEEPYYKCFSCYNIEIACIEIREIEKIKKYSQELKKYANKDNKSGLLLLFMLIDKAGVQICENQFGRAIKTIKIVQSFALKTGFLYGQTGLDVIIAKFYLTLLTGEEKIQFSVVLKNLGFIFKTIPVAYKRSLKHFRSAIATSELQGNKIMAADSFFGIARLYELKKKKKEAEESLIQCLNILKDADLDDLKNKAEKALRRIKSG